MYPYLIKKRKLTVSSFTLSRDDITRQLLVLLVCMENLSKNSLLQRSQGVSLSIADAKVDTFKLPTKYFQHFFERNLTLF